MLYTIVKKCSDYDDNGEDIDIKSLIGTDISQLDKETAKVKKRQIIKGKIQSVGKMNKMFTTLKQESEMILKIKNISPDGRLPRGILLEGRPAIRHAAK